MEFEETREAISLHGLGFVQVKLGGGQRLHVWHPDLPRRHCHEHSQIHDHRFGFESRVLVGTQVNDVYAAYETGVQSGAYLPPTHQAYLHEGERLPTGNRPWIPCDRLWVGRVSSETVEAGGTYHMLPYVFHATRPGGDGRVATVMTKVGGGERGSRSLVSLGVDPHVDFDRGQLTENTLWRMVEEVLGG